MNAGTSMKRAGPLINASCSSSGSVCGLEQSHGNNVPNASHLGALLFEINLPAGNIFFQKREDIYKEILA